MNTAVLDSQKGTVDREALLGRLLWSSIPDSTELDHRTVVEELTRLGFTRTMPGYPRESDVFKRVSKDLERRRVPHVGDPSQFENWMVRDVASVAEDTITRRIVVEVVDPNGKRLDYEQIADIQFKFGSEGTAGFIRATWLNGWNETNQPVAAEMIAQVKREYKLKLGKLPAETIRTWMRKTILDMGATAVRPSGGIYFLEERFADQVEALEEFVAKVLPEDADCHSVEIPDNGKQREMVRRAIEKETTGAIEDMMARISEIKKEGKLTPKKYLAMLTEVSELEAKIADYSKLLQTDIQAVDNRSRLLKGMVSGLSPLQKKITRTRKAKTNG